MTGVRLLDADVLDKFECLLRARAIRVDALSPGLTDTQIDDIIGPAGLELPDEVRAWWRWRNGGAVEVLPARAMVPLEHAVAQYTHDVQPDLGYYGDPERALRPVSEKAVILVQCVGSGDVAAPVYSLYDWTSPPRLVRFSFGELVDTWIGYIEQGIYATASAGGWSDAQEYSSEVLELGVA